MMSNLLQQHSMIVPDDRPVITVYTDDRGNLRCDEFGRVFSWERTQQQAHGVGGGGRRLCIHRLEPLPQTQLFGLSWALRLHWQSVVVESDPVIAGRTGDVVRLAFDRIGPTKGCRFHPLGLIPEHRWQYKLYRFKFWDDDHPCDKALLGVWPD